jgi:hypothetical protein
VALCKDKGFRGGSWIAAEQSNLNETAKLRQAYDGMSVVHDWRV